MLEQRITNTLGRNPARDVKVLIVDDDHRFEKMLSDMLSIFGFTNIYTASDGNSAISILNHTKIDFMLSDWQMPERSGIELLDYVRNDRNSPNSFLPIIFVTGKAEKKNVEEARDLGITEFLIKPFTVETLRDRIVSIFDKPREFILCEKYHGPCRRRSNIGPPDGIERRKNSA